MVFFFILIADKPFSNEELTGFNKILRENLLLILLIWQIGLMVNFNLLLLGILKLLRVDWGV